MTALYLLESDGAIAILDTAVNSAVPRILTGIEALGRTWDDVTAIIPTHAHLDHSGACGQLMALCPNATCYAHPRAARHLIDPSKLIEGARQVFGDEGFDAAYGEIRPVPADRVIEAPDGFRVSVGSRELHLLDAPGHAKHHLMIHDPAARTLVAGDAFGLAYPFDGFPEPPISFPTTSPVQFDPKAMKATFQRIAELNLEQVLIAHFGVLTGISARMRRLYQLVDDLAEAAETGDTGSALLERLADILVHEGDELGLELTPETLLKGFEYDLKVNVQGLEFWHQS